MDIDIRKIFSCLYPGFLALIIYRYVEKKLDEKYTAPEIIETLRDMNMTFTGKSDIIYIALQKCSTSKNLEVQNYGNIR